MEHLDVLIVGAGLSGVGAAHYVKTKCPWASFAVLEAREAMGGTWDLFRYPGIRSDSDMYTLGYSFRPWPGPKTISDGASILDYIRKTAASDGTDAAIRYGRRVTAAAWSTADARWVVTVAHTDTGETEELSCNFLFSCTGYYHYDHGYQPTWPGMDDFEGIFIHPQFWPEDLDYANKKVVVIGSGATAVTLVPSMADTAEHVTMLQRSPSYVVSLPEKSPIADVLRKVLPGDLGGNATRWALAMSTQSIYRLSKWFPNGVRKVLMKGVAAQLPDGYPVDVHFNPKYDPWDQRLAAVTDGDLFKGISVGKASVVTDTIDTFTATGIRTSQGTELEADIIISATGLDMLFMGGIDLSVDGTPVDVSDHFVYKGMMLSDIPNTASAIGYVNSSWTLKCELTCDYVTRLLNHMHETGLRECRPVLQDPAMGEVSLLELTSGYVARAADRFPKSGEHYPWRVYQSYIKDYRATKKKSIIDDVMEFSNPDPDAPRPLVTATSETSPRNRFDGRVAAITGAGSGIGRALAIDLARRGCHLALSDIDAEGMTETVNRCEGRGVKVTASVVDVADRAAVEAWAAQVVADHGHVNFIFNNAGVAMGATIESESYEDFEWLMNINFWGVVYGTKAFLPYLKESGDGHVINMSSVFGLVSIPSQSAYNAAKFAVRGFTDALRMELEIEGAPVSATTVHPGGVKTNIARRARLDPSMREMSDESDVGAAFDRIALTRPPKAAREILAAVAANQRRVLVGPDAAVIDLVSRMPAALYQTVLVKAGRRNAIRH